MMRMARQTAGVLCGSAALLSASVEVGQCAPVGAAFLPPRVPYVTKIQGYTYTPPPPQPYVPQVTPQEALRNPPQFGMPNPQFHYGLDRRPTDDSIVSRYPAGPGYGPGAGAHSRRGDVTDDSNAAVCSPFLRKYQATGLLKWRQRYRTCLKD